MRLDLCEQALHGMNLRRFGIGLHKLFFLVLINPSMQLVDYRVEFSKWWVTEFKHIKFPSQGTVFDYFLDHETKKWLPWSEKVPKFTHDPDMPLQVRLHANHVFD